MGLVRLVHPFPTVLNGLVTGVLAMMAGGSLPTAVRLATAMIALQASIGALNDLVDAPRDAGHKGGKPIPVGLVDPNAARMVVLVGLATGLILAAASGPPALAAAVLGTGAGYVYDLRLKGTPASWLPFALGIPMLPVFAWLGAVGTIPPSFVLLVPLAALSGAALAISNALADHERDLAAGSPSVATALGRGRAWLLHACLHAIVLVVGIAALGAAGAEARPAIAAAVVVIGGALLCVGGSPARRERGWELEATGTGLVAVVWLAAVVGRPA